MAREFDFASRYARKSDGDFVLAAGRAFWADYWANRNEDKIGPGTEILDLAPQTPRWALKLGRKLMHALADTYKIPATYGVPPRPYRDSIRDSALCAKLRFAADRDKGDRYPSDSNLGWYAAMQAMGHGVGLECCGLESIRVPYMEACPC